MRLSFRSPAQAGSQLLSRSHPLVVELADFVAERALSGLEPELAARASVIRTKAVSSRTQLLVLRLRHQLHQDRWTGNGYDALPDLLVEECLTVQVKEQSVEPLEGAAALELLEAAPTGNVDPGQRQQWLKDAVAGLDACNRHSRLWLNGGPNWQKTTTAASAKPPCAAVNRCGCASTANPPRPWM